MGFSLSFVLPSPVARVFLSADAWGGFLFGRPHASSTEVFFQPALGEAFFSVAFMPRRPRFSFRRRIGEIFFSVVLKSRRPRFSFCWRLGRSSFRSSSNLVARDFLSADAWGGFLFGRLQISSPEFRPRALRRRSTDGQERPFSGRRGPSVAGRQPQTSAATEAASAAPCGRSAEHQ